MEIHIDQTDQVVDLSIENEQGTDWIADFIGKLGGFGSVANGLIDRDPDADGRYLANAQTVEWLQRMIAAFMEMQRRIAEAKRRYGEDRIIEYLQSTHALEQDLQDQPESVGRALDQYEPQDQSP